MRRIEVTPEEAKQKLCPVIPPHIQSQHTDRPTLSNCVGHGCMLWAWASPVVEKGAIPGPDGKKLDRVTETGKGYCSA